MGMGGSNPGRGADAIATLGASRPDQVTTTRPAVHALFHATKEHALISVAVPVREVHRGKVVPLKCL